MFAMKQTLIHAQNFQIQTENITTLLMINVSLFQTQFCIAFIHSAQLLFHDCGFPRFSLFFTLPNAIFFYYLFYDFYNKAYPKDNKQLENGHAVSNGKAVTMEHSNGTAITTEDSNHTTLVATRKTNTKQTKKYS